MRNNLELYQVKAKDIKQHFGLVMDVRAESKKNEKGELGDYFGFELVGTQIKRIQQKLKSFSLLLKMMLHLFHLVWKKQWMQLL